MRILRCAILLLIVCRAGVLAQDEKVDLYLQSKAWFQFGRIMHSSDTVTASLNYNGNWLQSAGAQFTVMANIGDNMQGAMGLGGFQTQTQVGTEALSTKQLVLGFERYVTQARLSYFFPGRDQPLFVVNAGLFPFNYNRDVKNLGLYLLRGPVYPGLLVSEFDSKSIDTTVANILGLHLRNNLGPFSHDIILKSESEFRSNFDFSLAYLASLRVGEFLELGCGVNFYRLIPITPAFTNLEEESYRTTRSIESPYDRRYIFVPTDTIWYDTNGAALNTVAAGVDTVTRARSRLFMPNIENIDHIGVVSYADTTFLTHRGTKMMGRLSFDPKPFFGGGLFGEQDLKFYTEAALIGVRNYEGIYENRSERIAMVFGFNIPTFGWLDFLTLEVERYQAPFRNDFTKIDIVNSPVPVSNAHEEYNYARDPANPERLRADTNIAFADVDVENMHKDDIKWSLYLQKTVQKYIVFHAQVASDHFRPSLYHKASPRRETAFTDSARDYYLMFKIGYIF